MRALTSSLAALLFASFGCKAEKPPPPPPKKAPPAKAPPAEKEETEGKAQVGPAGCVKPWSTEGETQTVKVGDRTFEITGSRMVAKSADDDAKAVIGVMGNLKEDTAANLKNIETFTDVFKKANAEAIVVVGDIGETEEQMKNTLEPLAKSGLPVFAVIGNRERKAHFESAVGSYDTVFDMNEHRLIELDDVAFVSVPGYYDLGFIHAVEGCLYRPEDLEGTKEILEATDKPVVLVSHGGPKQQGEEALDYTLEKANVGDPAMAEMMKSAGVKFGFFANIHESGGKATDLAGKKVIPPKTPSESLYLNPGAVDAVSWQMNDGTRSVGMAAIFTMEDGKASYAVHRIREKK